MSSSQKKKDGISLRTINIWLIIGAVILSGLMFLFTYHLSTSFKHLADTAEQQVELRKAALELMDASDYLTEKVQRFTVSGNIQYVNDYFDEAFKAQHREDAVNKMESEADSSDALESLQKAMNGSQMLMNREYYAMRLVIEAKGYTDYPEKLRSVQLLESDQALSAEEKMQRAAEFVFDNTYYDQKDYIRENMQSCLNELERSVHSEDTDALEAMRSEMTLVRIIIVLQTIGTIFLVWMISRLGIHPILNAVDRIKSDSRIPEVGANEFRYLARTYNKMYEVYKNSLKRLNFKASHDELTGVYNRAGYDLLLSSIDLKSTYMILFDVDNFKSINDTYGHEVGDRVLIKLVQVLQNNFRADDYICRIGGDEFVVFMEHSADVEKDLIAAKIDNINKELEETDDGLPPASISVGITHGTEVSEKDKLFKKTDEAMYRSKRKGKHTYTFNNNNNKQ